MPQPESLQRRDRRDLLAALVALALPSFITWLYFFQAEGASAAVQLAVFNVVKVVQFAFPVVWVLAVQRGSFALRPPHARGVAQGMAFGAAVMAAMFGLYYGVLRGSELLSTASAEMVAKLQGWGVDQFWKYAALGAFYSLFHSLLEEYYWRWFVFGQLRRTLPHRLGTAIAVSSLGFMAHHVLVLGKYFGFATPATWLFSGCVAIGGAVWAWMYHRTGSLLGPWMSHMLVDAAIFLLGYDLVRLLFSASP